ncbi:IS5 family transposase [Streptomyces sp. NPDC047821]|uniref:IS5 family transposase n=1 Tax=Streptomyces sp. NPDC047821 TaxID=3365488 RepID=UPI003711EF48
MKALGRSRGGLTTEVHLVADGRCRPLSLLVAAGHRHDSLSFEAVMAGIRVPRIGNGRPRTRPAGVSADRAYSSPAIRSYCAVAASRRRSRSQPTKSPTASGAARGGRPPGFDRQAYKHRNTVERCINRIKQWRGIAMRTDNLAVHYLAALQVAATFLRVRT